jgi:hypothetical protein
MELRYSRKSEGVAQLCGPFGELFDIKTITCGHCGRIVYVSPLGDGTGELSFPVGAEHVLHNTANRQPPSVCHQCWSLVCPNCHADGKCTPLLKGIEQTESRRRFFESVGI